MDAKRKRLQWSIESMTEAVKIQGKGLRQAAREYDVPIATLKDDKVAINAKPGPSTVLTKDEEEKLCLICVIWAMD